MYIKINDANYSINNFVRADNHIKFNLNSSINLVGIIKFYADDDMFLFEENVANYTITNDNGGVILTDINYVEPQEPQQDGLTIDDLAMAIADLAELIGGGL